MQKLLIIVTVAIGVSAISCGSEKKDTCEQADEVRLAWCEEYESEGCLPCVCLGRGEDYNLVWKPEPFIMQVDIDASGCVPKEPCFGQTLEDARQCIEDNTTCNPCVHPDTNVIICDVRPFPDLCLPEW